jgi:hypothetical protein
MGETYSPRWEHILSSHGHPTASNTRRRHAAAHPRMSRKAVNADHIHFERAEPPRGLAEGFRNRRRAYGSRSSGGILFRIAEYEEGHQLRI